ncbi:hypothetical protein [Pseudarthrobacter siccitolerans]
MTPAKARLASNGWTKLDAGVTDVVRGMESKANTGQVDALVGSIAIASFEATSDSESPNGALPEDVATPETHAW